MIDQHIQKVRDAIDAADLSRLDAERQRAAKHLLDSWATYVRDLAIAVASGDKKAENEARKDLAFIADAFLDILAQLDIFERKLFASVTQKAMRVAGDVADSALRYAADVAISSLAKAALGAFAGTKR